MKASQPTISVVIPTLNASSVLERCLKSIQKQHYPKEKIEIIIIDGGSVDNTRSLAKKYHCRILENPLKTAESGKAVGVRDARKEIVALIDSDNILPNKGWFKKMVEPFKDEEIILSEPIKYTYRKKDPYLTRYFALLGMNDPICLFTGNYDRYSYLTNRWTDLKFPEINKKHYLKIILDHMPIPTIGANGTLIRTDIIRQALSSQKYLFDIDILIKIIKKSGFANIAKVKTGIIHTFVEDDMRKFFKKQSRRMNDMSYHRSRKNRDIDWQNTFLLKVIWFMLQCALVIPIIGQTIIGYLRKPDIAWLFHPIACYSTLFIYLYGWLKGKILPRESSRYGWKQ